MFIVLQSRTPLGRFLPGTHWRPHQIFREKAYLVQEYVTKQRSCRDIAADHGMNSGMAIGYWLRRHNIPRRKPSEVMQAKFGRSMNEIERAEYFRLLRLAFPQKYRAIYLRDRPKRKAQWQQRRQSNPDSVITDRSRCREWQKRNPVAYAAATRRYRLKHPEKYREYDRKRRPAKTTYTRERRRNDIPFKIASVLRGRVSASLRGRNKSASTLALLGCSIESFRLYLESRFEPGMTWENYGRYPGWQIDHIMPCAIFDLTKPEHQKRCFHFSNMQPMWAIDNIRKSDKVEVPQMRLL